VSRRPTASSKRTLLTDAIIEPAQTREALLTALEAVALNPEVAKFNPGILQT